LVLTIWFCSLKFLFLCLLFAKESNCLYFSGDSEFVLVWSSSSKVSLLQRRMCLFTTYFPTLEPYTPEALMSGLVTVFCSNQRSTLANLKGSLWVSSFYWGKPDRLPIPGCPVPKEDGAVTLMVAIKRNGSRQPWSADLLLLLEIEYLDSFWQIVNEFLFNFLIYFRLSDSNL